MNIMLEYKCDMGFSNFSNLCPKLALAYECIHHCIIIGCPACTFDCLHKATYSPMDAMKYFLYGLNSCNLHILIC